MLGDDGGGDRVDREAARERGGIELASARFSGRCRVVVEQAGRDDRQLDTMADFCGGGGGDARLVGRVDRGARASARAVGIASDSARPMPPCPTIDRRHSGRKSGTDR